MFGAERDTAPKALDFRQHLACPFNPSGFVLLYQLLRYRHAVPDKVGSSATSSLNFCTATIGSKRSRSVGTASCVVRERTAGSKHKFSLFSCFFLPLFHLCYNALYSFNSTVSAFCNMCSSLPFCEHGFYHCDFFCCNRRALCHSSVCQFLV